MSVETQQETFETSSSIPRNKDCLSDVMNLAVLWRLGIFRQEIDRKTEVLQVLLLLLLMRS